jgi:hypothetical protein
MAFEEDWARDPKNDSDFWNIVEETFSMVEYVLHEHRVETREEALAGTLRLEGGATFRDPTADIIRYRGVDKDVDSRDYFLELGRRFLPKVERQIKARKLTPKFAKDWGVAMMCHGFISAHILDDSDGLSHQRAGLKKPNKNGQRKWIAHQLLRHFKAGCKRKQAEGRVEKLILGILERGEFPTGFDRSWFQSMLKDGALVHTYDQKHMPDQDLQEFADQPTDEIPPLDFSP